MSLLPHSIKNYLCMLLLWCSIMLPADTAAPHSVDQYDEIMFAWTRTWAEVIDLVKQKHYQVKQPEDALRKAIDTFLNTLDPHSNFLDPETYTQMLESTSGTFHGIGIMINNTRKPKDKFLTIVETIPDGPAEKAGLKQYDKIIQIDDTILEGISTEKATTLLKGPRGSTVTVKIMREGHTDLLTFTLTRDIIKEQHSLCFYIKSKNIYYLSLAMFADTSAKQIEQLLKKATQDAHKGIILDLRNNSGGLLTSAIDIAGLFLDQGSVVVTTKNTHQKTPETYKTKRSPIAHRSVPIVILINNYTASAGEILAGCLKVHAEKNSTKTPLLVFLVGTPTFGKGSVQEVIPVGQNSAIKLTTALYFLAYDTPVQGIGITPDIIVERYAPPLEQNSWLTEHYGRESALENHITIDEKKEISSKKVTEKKEEKTDTWHDRIKQMLAQDNQLREAINILSLISNAQKNLPTFIKNRTTALAYIEQNYMTNTNVEIVEIK